MADLAQLRDMVASAEAQRDRDDEAEVAEFRRALEGMLSSALRDALALSYRRDNTQPVAQFNLDRSPGKIVQHAGAWQLNITTAQRVTNMAFQSEQEFLLLLAPFVQPQTRLVPRAASS